MSTNNLARMEQRYGALGLGADALAINGRTYTLWELMKALGLVTEGVIRPVDAFYLAEEDLYVIRYFDFMARAVIAHEFFADFRYHQEMRAHLADVMGDEEYFAFPWSMSCPWTI